MWTIPKPRYKSGLCADGEAEIAVNIGGVRVVLFGDVLKRFPESRLAELLNCSAQNYDVVSSLCDDFDQGRNEFYFDRDPDAFKCIIDVYYFGEIHIKRGICPICFIKEMEFWKIDPSVLDECCKSYLTEKEEELEEIANKVKLILEDLEVEPCVTRSERCQRFLWRLMEKPDSSLPARVIAIASFLSILVSSVVMCVGTIPELQVADEEGKLVEHPALDAIETCCIMWFTAEYLLRLVSSPNKLRFVFAFMNVVDFMAIVPFYVVLSLTYLGTTAMMELGNVQQAVQALRIMRIARIFKLARHSSGLQTLTYALKRSLKELGLLLMYMSVGIFVFSALAYTMEQSHPETLFRSIPQSFWWAIITMTTVGYGDIYPKTTLGKCNAAVSFLCGVIAIALPIHPIINNFVVFYNKQRVLETAAKHEVELMELKSGRDAQRGGGGQEEAAGAPPDNSSRINFREALQMPGVPFPLSDPMESAEVIKDRRKLQKVIRSAERVIGCNLPPLQTLHDSRALKRATKIMADPSHPGHDLFTPLPSGRRLRSVKTDCPA
ncbi:voltage-gated potassium channel regulatory subunit KCNF1-like [Diretmus argenteus]